MYQIVVEDASGDKESIDDYTKIIYEGELNGVHIFEVLIETSGSSQRTKFASGNKIHIYRGSTLEMTGVIEKLTHTSSNFMRIQGIGEGDTNLKNAQAPAKLWTSTNTTGVVSGAGNLISYVSGTVAGTVENQTVDSFKTTEGMSVLVAVRKLCELTGQDWSFDYTNNELDVEDHKGSAATIATLNEAFDVKNVEKIEDDRTNVEKVTVIGAGYGDTQIKGSADSGAFVQGDKEITIVDKNVTTNTEATARALAEYTVISGTDTTYSFQVLNPNMTFVLGDVITLYDDTTSTNTTLRIVRYKRTVTPYNETLTFQVRGTSSRYAAIDRLKQDKLVQQYATDGSYIATASSPLDIIREANTDSATNPVIVGPFTISSSSPTIDKATLQIYRKNVLYDVSSTSAADGGHSDHGIDGSVSSGTAAVTDAGHSDHGITGSVGSAAMDAAFTTSSAYGASVACGTTFTTCSSTFVAPAAGNWLFGLFHINFKALNSGNGAVIVYFKVRNTTDGTDVPSSSPWMTFDCPENDYGSCVILVQGVAHATDDLEIQVKTNSATGGIERNGFSAQFFGKHIHSDTFDDGTGTADVSDSGHPHGDTLDDGTGTADITTTPTVSNVADADTVGDGDLKWRVYTYTAGSWVAGTLRSTSGTFDVGDITSEIDISGDLSGADEYYVAVYDVSGIIHRYTGRVRIHVS